jgi:hypothetical protein
VSCEQDPAPGGALAARVAAAGRVAAAEIAIEGGGGSVAGPAGFQEASQESSTEINLDTCKT